MRNIHKMQSGTQLPKVLGGSLSPTFAFQSSGAGFSFTRSEFSTGVFALKFFDDAGTEAHIVHHGVDASGAGAQTITLESTPNGHNAFVDVRALGGFTVNNWNVGSPNTDDTMIFIEKLWNDVNTSNSRPYFVHTIEHSTPRVTQATSGIGITVGTGYIAFIDTVTGDPVFAMQTLSVGSNNVTNVLPYTLPTNGQSLACVPGYNGTYAICGMGDSPTTNNMRSKAAYQLNATLAIAGKGAVYWADENGYDGDTLKVGGTSTTGWAEFYEDGELVAMCQFGTEPNDGQHTKVVSYPKTFPVGEGANVKVVLTPQLGTRYTANAYAQNDTSFSMNSDDRNLNTVLTCYYIAWWVKEP